MSNTNRLVGTMRESDDDNDDDNDVDDDDGQRILWMMDCVNE